MEKLGDFFLPYIVYILLNYVVKHDAFTIKVGVSNKDTPLKHFI